LAGVSAGVGAGAGTAVASPALGWALILMVAGLLLPLGEAGWWFQHPTALGVAALAPVAAAWLGPGDRRRLAGAVAALAVLAGSSAVLLLLAAGRPTGIAAPGLWLYVLGLGLLAWRAMADLAALRRGGPLVPGLFGLGILFVWEVVVAGFAVPGVLLPAPTAIGRTIAASLPILAADFMQTFVRAVVPGWALGSLTGFLVAVVADRVPFLQRGLLPLGNLVAALPIVGIAPIMVMWFGFDWHSKVAVVVVMTFFPMLVNALAGLAAAGRTERDLMRALAASPMQTLLKLRLPTALPFVFNALKINSTLALIGAIVAEFFGTPIVGMGFRISTEVGRMNLDLVWATIVVAALAGSAFYGGLALLERAATFWHPSYRR
jgi:NitT/TauT family transport system permease protein